MLDLLAANPLLTIMLVVAGGTLLGMVPFGPVRFGAAGALFVGLAVGALDPRLGEGFGLVQTLGLVLFVYMVGLAAGAASSGTCVPSCHCWVLRSRSSRWWPARRCWSDASWTSPPAWPVACSPVR